MKNFILLLFLIVLLTSISKASSIIEVDNLYFEVEKTVSTNRGYTLPENTTPKNNFNLGLNLSDKWSVLYLNSEISSTTTKSQFGYVGLDSELGLNTTIGLQLYYRHFSGHLLDATSEDRFPEENVIGVRLNLIGN